jgi:hypothetical protein
MYRDGDRLLQLLIFNKEFLVSTSQQLVLTTSLPFVHTARRFYWLSVVVNYSDGFDSSFYFRIQKFCKPQPLEKEEVVTRFS